MKNPTARKFNPGLNQGDNDLAAQYVVRESLLDEALDQIRANTDADSNVHCLYYAPRGRGKTMLLARIEVAVRQDNQLNASWLVVRLFEENYYEIASAGELWLAVIRQLSMTDIEENQRQSARAAHDDLARRDSGDSFDAAAIAVLGDLLNALGRRVVLMVENLQELDDELDDAAGWAVRKVLQNEPRLMLMATATSYFSSMQQAKHAFYELFDSREIPALNRRECTVLWNHITGDERSEEQVRPLQILTGGSPRLLNVMAQFGQNLDIAELMEDLTGLIDERTDYFKSQIESLPSKERRVFVALADLWHPSTAAEIAERARQSVPKVSALLNRLEGRGALIVDGSQPRKKKYAIAERLFCIYYKLRSQRNDAAVAEALIDFMIGFYPLKVQAKVREQFCNHPAFERVANERGFGVAAIIGSLGEAPEMAVGEPVMWAMVSRAYTLGQQGDWVAAVAAYEEMIERFGGVPETGVREQVARAMVSRGYILGQQGDLAEEVAAYKEMIECFGEVPEEGIREQVARAMVSRAYALYQRGDWVAAVAAYEEMIERFGEAPEAAVRGPVARAMVGRAFTLCQQGGLAAAVAAYDQMIERFGEATDVRDEVAMAMLGRATTLGSQDNWVAEVAAYEQMIERFGEAPEAAVRKPVAMAMVNHAITLGRQGDLEAEVTCYMEVIERFIEAPEEGVRNSVVQAMGNRMLVLAVLSDWENTLLAAKLLRVNTADAHVLAVVALTEGLVQRVMNAESRELSLAISRLCEKAARSADHSAEQMQLALGVLALLPTEEASDMLKEVGVEKELAPLLVYCQREAGELVSVAPEMSDVVDDVAVRVAELREQLLAPPSEAID